VWRRGEQFAPRVDVGAGCWPLRSGIDASSRRASIVERPGERSGTKANRLAEAGQDGQGVGVGRPGGRPLERPVIGTMPIGAPTWGREARLERSPGPQTRRVVIPPW